MHQHEEVLLRPVMQHLPHGVQLAQALQRRVCVWVWRVEGFFVQFSDLNEQTVEEVLKRGQQEAAVERPRVVDNMEHGLVFRQIPPYGLHGHDTVALLQKDEGVAGRTRFGEKLGILGIRNQS